MKHGHRQGDLEAISRSEGEAGAGSSVGGGHGGHCSPNLDMRGDGTEVEALEKSERKAVVEIGVVRRRRRRRRRVL